MNSAGFGRLKPSSGAASVGPAAVPSAGSSVTNASSPYDVPSASTLTARVPCSEDEGAGKVTTSCLARSVASAVKSASSSSLSDVEATVPPVAFEISTSGESSVTFWSSDTTSTRAPVFFACVTTAVSSVSVVSMPSESSRTLRWPSSPVSSSALSTPSYRWVAGLSSSEEIASLRSSWFCVGSSTVVTSLAKVTRPM